MFFSAKKKIEQKLKRLGEPLRLLTKSISSTRQALFFAIEEEKSGEIGGIPPAQVSNLLHILHSGSEEALLGIFFAKCGVCDFDGLVKRESFKIDKDSYENLFRHCSDETKQKIKECFEKIGENILAKAKEKLAHSPLLCSQFFRLQQFFPAL